MAASAQAAPQPDPGIAQRPRSAGQAAGKSARGVVRGMSGFLHPFRRVGGILWLEITGTFFLLFALVFGSAAWRTRPVSFHGPYGKPFLAAAAMLAVFLYLGVTSFLKAGRK
jgi:hypothetical protein